MSKFARRGISIAAASLAGAMAFSTLAAADIVDGEPIDDDAVTVDGATAVPSPETPVWRLFGPDRIETAVRAAERVNFSGDGVAPVAGDEPDTVFLANSQVFADALAAAPLADALDAPILLNTPGGDRVNNDVEDYFEGRTAPADVVVLGGDNIFNQDFRDDLAGTDGVGDIEVVSGVNRYETALQLALLAGGGDDDGDGDGVADGEFDATSVFLASGTDFPDALAAGGAAAGNSGVILLTVGEDRVTQSTFDALATDGAFAGTTNVAVGGPAADAAAFGTVDSGPIEVDETVIGDDRYETAVEVADNYLSSGASEAGNLVVASGINFADAVVGGSLAGNVNGALLLTQNDRLPNVTRDFIASQTIQADNVFVLGGTNSVSNQVVIDIANEENPAR